MTNILPRNDWQVLPIDDEWETLDKWYTPSPKIASVAFSEDQNHVYVDAALPGVAEKDIKTVFRKGVLFINAEAEETAKNKQYYRKATDAFAYRIAVPGYIDEQRPPKQTYKHGILTVAFTKANEANS